MPSKLARSIVIHLIAVASVGWLGSTTAAQVRTEKWHLIRLQDPRARHATIRAIEAAAARLENDDCRKVLTDFRTGNGATLADQLSSLNVDIPTYFAMITFVDESRDRLCSSGVLLFTSPGSRVVRVCGDELKRISAQRPQYIVASVIHEILHTLGLGETPPSPGEITARVVARCGLK
jgi:hypothetical protein